MKQGVFMCRSTFPCIACGHRSVQIYTAYRWDDLMECQWCEASWLYEGERAWTEEGDTR